ncbi:bifunctional uroporphyrinogen-III C-methyltransferase/uroporphyrinogen-III synthase [Actinoallomurus liliacearum]|uniref:Bifunctional uroporphyrinogen-III C-methyltransferase/uroporphyrinogen-III synthase n=2 Tax=Actinoallomurus liliacearum TaxID=1080073 RepID=A0ABP8TE77_9ACTN
MSPASKKAAYDEGEAPAMAGTTPGERQGMVAFVGVGPGDPELVTLRAARILGKADVIVVHETLAPPYRAHFNPAADVVGPAGVSLVSLARSGKVVARVFGGDPGLGCALTEDVKTCAKGKVPFEIVPGVSSVTGVPGYAGIPLTDGKHREVVIVDAQEGGVDWSAHANAATLVILGVENTIGEVAKGLMAAGRSDTTPVAVTSMGTTTEQYTVDSTLAKVASDTKHLESPALLVVGDVVRWRDKMSWFESKPLFGWRVLVPRTKEQAASLSDQLRSYGAVPDEVPTISVEPPRTPQQMERAVKGLVTGRYEWVVFTSTNAVRAVRERFEQYGLDARAFAGLKVAAVGEQTAAALVEFGVKPDLMPKGQQSSEGLVEVWPPYDKDLDPINRVLLPRADIATETLVAGLTELGWECDDVTAYRTVRAAPPPAPIREAIKGGGFDAVLFTSSSTVRNLIGIAGKPHNVTVIACIGPQTARTAEEYGLRVDVLADSPSVSALAEALAEYGSKRRAAQVEAGDPLRKPSEMRRGARRRK